MRPTVHALNHKIGIISGEQQVGGQKIFFYEDALDLQYLDTVF